jgi:hypothetical protein
LKKSEVAILAFVAGGIATYALLRTGIISFPVRLGQTGPYHNFGPAMGGGIPARGWVSPSTIGAAKVF